MNIKINLAFLAMDSRSDGRSILSDWRHKYGSRFVQPCFFFCDHGTEYTPISRNDWQAISIPLCSFNPNRTT